MPRFSLDAALRGLEQGDLTALARTVSLLESERADDRESALVVLDRALELRRARVVGGVARSGQERPGSRRVMRVGITGPPGVGKSTFIEALGVHLLEASPTSRLAVLAIDPSSRRTGGSILGDKTRMPRLAVHPRAFVRPSAAGVHLGGVAARTREVLSLSAKPTTSTSSSSRPWASASRRPTSPTWSTPSSCSPSPAAATSSRA